MHLYLKKIKIMQIMASVVFYSENYIKHINALCVQNAEFINVIVGGTYCDMAPENQNIMHCELMLPFILENTTERWSTYKNTS
jgi:hypothetical protein